jgi:hypothetical protein
VLGLPGGYPPRRLGFYSHDDPVMNKEKGFILRFMHFRNKMEGKLCLFLMDFGDYMYYKKDLFESGS